MELPKKVMVYLDEDDILPIPYCNEPLTVDDELIFDLEVGIMRICEDTIKIEFTSGNTGYKVKFNKIAYNDSYDDTIVIKAKELKKKPEDKTKKYINLEDMDGGFDLGDLSSVSSYKITTTI